MLVALAAATLLLFQAASAAGSAPVDDFSASVTVVGKKAAVTTPVSPVTVEGKKEKGSEDQTELTCHSEIPLGSRFPQKVCARREDVTERRLTDQEQIRRWVALRPGSGN